MKTFILGHKKKKPTPKILRVLRTKGMHSWVETDKGIFKKPNSAIPKELFI